MTPPRIRVEDAPPAPGLRHAILAALAPLLDRSSEALLPAPGADDDVHARQHVTPDGRSEENGVLWLERAGVPWRRREAVCAELVPVGAESATTVRTLWRGDMAELRDPLGGLIATATADRYRRLALEPGPAWPQWLRPTAAVAREPAGPALRIAILGVPERLRDVYCAVLAALGDAADAQGVALDVVLAQEPLTVVAPEIDGLVLPGGADMSQVEPLAAAVAAARQRRMPVLGLCLGTQSMALEAVRRQPGCSGAALGEIEPDAGKKLYAPMLGADGASKPRLGDRDVLIREGRLAEILRHNSLPTRWAERMNHRFRFDRAYEHALSAAGFEISALEGRDDSVDVIARRDCGFFVGAQGHPELNSTARSPHPLFAALVRAAIEMHKSL